jgi:putative Holliday junction resolvase
MQYRLLAVDYGEKRIGLALSDPMRIFAKPLQTIPNTSLNEIISKLKQIISEKQVGKLIVGIPWSLDGTETAKTSETREFLSQLSAGLDIPVIGWDERYTTDDANELLKQMGLDWKKARTVIDAMAACLILKRFMERNPDA